MKLLEKLQGNKQGHDLSAHSLNTSLQARCYALCLCNTELQKVYFRLTKKKIDLFGKVNEKVQSIVIVSAHVTTRVSLSCAICSD